MTLTSPRHEDDLARVEHNLTNHKPGEDQIERIEGLRDYAKAYGNCIAHLAIDGREKSLALTALEESLMWAVASVARAEENPGNE